jgi:hypothetical protein
MEMATIIISNIVVQAICIAASSPSIGQTTAAIQEANEGGLLTALLEKELVLEIKF